MTTPTIGSILLASTNPQRLRSWYLQAFNPPVDPNGFLLFGPVAVLIDERHDIASTAVEPGRTILNFHVDDARKVAQHLDTLGATWIAPLEQRADGWFAAVADPDHNIIQIIELSPEYLARTSRATEASAEPCL